MRVTERDASLWSEVRRVWLERGSDAGRCHRVEHARAYRDRLVLKLEGIEGPTAAAALRGFRVLAEESASRPLPEGEYHAARLLGMEVRDEDQRLLGTVRDVVPTGGTDILVVSAEAGGEEILVPVAPAIVRSVDNGRRRITVRLPDGLEDINRR